ncbi:MAG: hypothetical protein QOK18_3857 [Mycobacterium sp.]|nr:hypothetical protein [Mycobacterium sp.]
MARDATPPPPYGASNLHQVSVKDLAAHTHTRDIVIPDQSTTLRRQPCARPTHLAIDELVRGLGGVGLTVTEPHACQRRDQQASYPEHQPARERRAKRGPDSIDEFEPLRIEFMQHRRQRHNFGARRRRAHRCGRGIHLRWRLSRINGRLVNAVEEAGCSAVTEGDRRPDDRRLGRAARTSATERCRGHLGRTSAAERCRGHLGWRRLRGLLGDERVRRSGARYRPRGHLDVLGVVGRLRTTGVGLSATVVTATGLVVATVLTTVARGVAVPTVTITIVTASRVLVGPGVALPRTARICGHYSDAGSDDRQRRGDQSSTGCHAQACLRHSHLPIVRDYPLLDLRMP